MPLHHKSVPIPCQTLSWHPCHHQHLPSEKHTLHHPKLKPTIHWIHILSKGNDPNPHHPTEKTKLPTFGGCTTSGRMVCSSCFPHMKVVEDEKRGPRQVLLQTFIQWMHKIYYLHCFHREGSNGAITRAEYSLNGIHWSISSSIHVSTIQLRSLYLSSSSFIIHPSTFILHFGHTNTCVDTLMTFSRYQSTW